MRKFYLLTMTTILFGNTINTMAIVPQVKTNTHTITKQTTKDKKSVMKTSQIGSLKYYLVENETDLRSIGGPDYPLSDNYMLNCDITLKQEWIPLGKEDDTPFTGRFDGNGFKISNVMINDKDAAYKYIGFFGLVEGGTLHNITLEKVSISTTRKQDVVVAPKSVVAATVLDGEMTDCVVVLDKK